MAAPKRKPKTLVEILGSPTVLAIEKVVQEVDQHTGRTPTEDAVEDAVDILLNGRVKDATIVMYDKTPVVRVNIRHGSNLYRINKTEPLRQLIYRQTSGHMKSAQLAEKLLPLLPQDQLALQIAAIENAAAEAMQDPKKLAPIRARLNAKRAADKERLVARIREVFKDHDDLLSEDEVLQLWRETFAAEVMNS